MPKQWVQRYVYPLIAIAAFLAPGQTAIARSGSDSDYQTLVDDLRRCARIGDAEERLRQYDALAARLAVSPEVPPLTDSGNWRVSTATSPIDDSATVTLSLKAETPIQGWPGKTETPQLIIRFKEKKLEVFVVTGFAPHVEHDSRATATVRFDAAAAAEVRFSKSTDGEALFWPGPQDAIRQMAAAEKLVFRFTPFNSSPVVTSFTLRGLRNAIIPLETASGWRIDDQTDVMSRRLSSAIRGDRAGSIYTRVDGTKVTIEVEGNRWRPGFRDDGARDLLRGVFESVAKACSGEPTARLRITVFGTTVSGRTARAGEGPFKSADLLAIARGELTALGSTHVELVDGGDVEPERYGESAPSALRGQVQRTGERVVIEVLGTK